MDDRRSAPRIPMRAEAEVRFTSWAVFQLIWTVNISQGGMQLEVRGEEPKTGSTLIIKLTPPTGASIDLEAVVKHAADQTKPNAIEKRWQVGVQFSNLDAARKQAIEQMIRAQGGSLPPISLRKKDGK
jgi:c-di-GMP-binding flagellar brake protein YcgR